MSSRLIGSLTLVVLLLLPGTAAARLPDFANNRIASKSIGGVRLGLSFGQVTAIWGGGGVDRATGVGCGSPQTDGTGWTCTWRQSATVKAWVSFVDGKAQGIGIAGSRDSRPGRLRTVDGLGLGTRAAVLFSKPGCTSFAGTTGVVYRCNAISFKVSPKTGRTTSVAVGSS